MFHYKLEDFLPMVSSTEKVNRYPLTDIALDGDNLVVELALAGFKKENITIELTDNKLNVVGERSENGYNYYQQHISSSSFKRTIALAPEYTGGNISASMEDGLLTIVINKIDPVKNLIKIK